MKINYDSRFLVLFFFLILFDMTGESTLYASGSKGRPWYSPYVIAGVLSYAVAAAMYYNIAKKTPLLVINTFWHMTIFTVMTLMGVFYFKNKITVARGVGLLFAFAAIICMYLSNIHGL